MKEQSKRQFIRSCFYLALSVVSFVITSLFAGCNKKEKSTSQTASIKQEKKERLTGKGTAANTEMQYSGQRRQASQISISRDISFGIDCDLRC